MTNRFVGREYLTGVQYSSDANLAARQSLYRFQVPPVQNAVWTLDCAQLQGDERVLDVGCGNGVHLAELAARAHRGTVHGLDLSPGMLAAAGSRSAATLTVGDAQGLPFATGSLDAVFAMHMLYHVPDRDLAVAEIKRVLRSDGIALISTNSEQHLLELTEMIAAVEKAQGRPASGAGRAYFGFSSESGAAELGRHFASVERHDVRGELVITEVPPLLDYIATMTWFIAPADGNAAAVRREIDREVRAAIARDGAFRIRTDVGCFVCR